MKDEYQVGRQFHGNALAIIHDVDSVFCLFPGPWNGCTEVPEHAKLVCDALNKHDPLPSDAVHGNAVNINGEWMDWRDALAAEQARAERLANALRPFAELAELFDDDRRGGNMPSTGLVMRWPRIGREYDMTVEHLRAARAALALRPSGDGVG